ncbi:MAG: DUF4407 domain-containing protein [Prevotella sp.]|nr:DUF4407 domain-containing protein [Prevotella sp.]
MNMWIKFGCMLTGWSSEVLAQCSQASRSHLNKYTSALLILILIWGVTGFCFAQRYIGLPVWACGFVSLFFITIVIMIERQIILTSEKTFSMVLFRAVIAFIMAIVGSTIFDQTMFGKDIDKQMASTIEVQAAELTAQRVHIIDEKLSNLKMEKDSIEQVNFVLQNDVNAHPMIKQTGTTQVPVTVQNPDGTTKAIMKTVVSTSEVPNPKQEVIEGNNKKLAQLAQQEQVWSEKKQSVEEDTRVECKENVGFLEELEAMWTIITTRKLAGAFYAVFFFLLMSLELFVVVSKMVDKECDYEAAIKGGQRVKIAQFNKAFNHVSMPTVA